MSASRTYYRPLASGDEKSLKLAQQDSRKRFSEESREYALVGRGECFGRKTMTGAEAAAENLEQVAKFQAHVRAGTNAENPLKRWVVARLR